MIRTVGAFLGSIIVGFVVAGVGLHFLPEHPQPSQAVLDAAAGKPFDASLAAEWLAEDGRPWAVLAWVIFPLAAVAMGATAAAVAIRRAPEVAACSVVTAWTALNWDSRLDLETASLGVIYVVAGGGFAWLGSRLRGWRQGPR